MALRHRSPETVIIAGAGHCGGRVALSLRELGFEGIIRLFGDEPHPPYERPPLSKGVLSGELPAESVLLKPRAFYVAAGIDFRPGVRLEEVSSIDRTVETSEGQRFDYDHLVIATGGVPRALPVPAAVQPRLHTLKTLDDVHVVQAAARSARRLCVLGAGFLGLEVGATLKAQGLEVTVIEREGRALARVLPAQIAAEVASRFAAEGIRIAVDTSVTGIDAAGDAASLALSDGGSLVADLVLAAIGQVPVAPRIDGQTVAGPDGIATDAAGRTAWPRIFAAGDVAKSFRPRLGRSVRYESWANAEHQARSVARAILDLAPEPEPVPWFWTEHFGLMLRMVGDVAAGACFVAYRSDKEGTLQWFALDSHDRLVGAAAYGSVKGVVRPMRLAERAIASGHPQDPSGLATGGRTTA